MYVSVTIRLYREDLAVSGQLDDSSRETDVGLYREDLAVSGQLGGRNFHSRLEIIPRGFGGIRTTSALYLATYPMIIPRGFGGIRTTIKRIILLSILIIPRGFGGIRTTR